MLRRPDGRLDGRPDGRPDGRQARLRRRLLAVLCCDATSVAVLNVLAVATRSRPTGAGYRAVARTATASLVPGAVAVALERHAHRPGATGRHGVLGTVLLLVAGSVTATVGAGRVLARPGPPRRDRARLVAVDVALLVGGNAVGVPYLALVRALHRSRPDRGR